MSHDTAASHRDRSQTLPASGPGAAPIEVGQFLKTFPGDFSQSCLTLVQTYHEGNISKSDTIKRLAKLVIDELERASRAGDNIKGVTSVFHACLEVLGVFEKEQTGSRQEPILGREDWVEIAKVQVAATPNRGREEEGKPDRPVNQSIDLDLIPFGRPDSAKLPDDLRLTHELQDNYGRDSECAKAMLLRDPSRPEFPSNLWANILANTFIDFNQIISQLMDSVDRRISGSADWAYTWDKYEKAVLFAFPHRERELQQYRTHILRLFLALPETPYYVILQYDIRVRTRVAESYSLRLCDFSEFNYDLLLLVNREDEDES